MRQVYEYDENGQFKRLILIGDEEELPKNCTDIPLPDGMWKPTLKSGQWVDIATDEEKIPPVIIPELSPLENQVELMQKAIDDLILGGMF